MAQQTFAVAQQLRRYPTNKRVPLFHHTASKTLRANDTGSVHTNLGADGTITLTLPQDARQGDMFHFVVMAAQELRIDPGAAGALYINGAKKTDDYYAGADAINENVTLIADGNGDWVAMGTEGTWTVQS